MLPTLPKMYTDHAAVRQPEVEEDEVGVVGLGREQAISGGAQGRAQEAAQLPCTPMFGERVLVSC